MCIIMIIIFMIGRPVHEFYSNKRTTNNKCIENSEDVCVRE